MKDAGRTRRRNVHVLLGGGHEGLLLAFSLPELAVVALRVGHVFAERDPDERDEDEVGDRDGADGRVGERRGGCVFISPRWWYHGKESMSVAESSRARKQRRGTHEQRGNRA